MAVEIRQATSPEDLKFVLELVEMARSQRELWASSWTQALISSECASAFVFLACIGGQPVGFLLLRPPGAAWEITLTAVSASVRRLGVFSQLLRWIVEGVGRGAIGGATGSALGPEPMRPSGLANSDQIHTQIDLEVRADNLPAIEAYKKAGFVARGRRRGYYADGVDALLYSFS